MRGSKSYKFWHTWTVPFHIWNGTDRCAKKKFIPFLSLHLWLFLPSLSFSSFFLRLSLHLPFFLLLSFSRTFTSPFFFLSFFFFPFFLFCHILFTFSIFFFPPVTLPLCLIFFLRLGHCHWDWQPSWSSASLMRPSPWRSVILISFFFFLRLWIPCDCDYCDCDWNTMSPFLHENL